jgi:L-methionine (R)-S-oxide reductase
MADSVYIPDTVTGKAERYQLLLPQLKALTEGETDLIANLSNTISALHHAMGFFWTGIYFVKDNQLVLGPFQGPVACTRISFGKGVCGTAWKESRTIVVEDVEAFPGHIACSALSRSEIVVPVLGNDKVTMVIDADSDKLSAFDETDAYYIEEVAKMIAQW